jgi:hypothetical protein
MDIRDIFFALSGLLVGWAMRALAAWLGEQQ